MKNPFRILFLLPFFGSYCLLPAQLESSSLKPLPKISAEELRLDFDLFRQGMEKYHTGLYWYTSKEDYDQAFDSTLALIQAPMDVLAFNRLIAPLAALSREDHCNLFLPEAAKDHLRALSRFPFTVKFLKRKMHLIYNGSQREGDWSAWEVVSINDQSPVEMVTQLGSMFASDGYAQAVKYSDLEGFSFGQYFLRYHGYVNTFRIVLQHPQTQAEKVLEVEAIPLKEIIEQIQKRPSPFTQESEEGDNLEFKIYRDSIAYLGIHTFGTSDYKENEIHRNYPRFLQNAFRRIREQGISHLIIDVSQNGGGSEGNENLLFSYLADNYQKYHSVTTKAHKVRLDNGVDPAIKHKTFGFWERVFNNRKREDGSYERKENGKFGLMAYKKEPKEKYRGKVYLMISPITYSGGSEFASMIYTRQRGKVYGEETGGGYQGNTSGYSFRLELPHSGIAISIPALKFHMNVSGLPEGSPVVPHQQVIPSLEQYLAREEAVLQFILEEIQQEDHR